MDDSEVVLTIPHIFVWDTNWLRRKIHADPDIRDWPPKIEPWWPSFCGLKCFLNTSINKKPLFFSEVVKYKNGHQKISCACAEKTRLQFLPVQNRLNDSPRGKKIPCLSCSPIELMVESKYFLKDISLQTIGG